MPRPLARRVPAFGAALVAAAAANAFAEPRINEIRIDQPSTDNDEYFELHGTPGESLDGLTYVVIGDGSAAAGSGVIEAVVPLTGHVLAADGLFLVGETTLTFGTADLTVGATGLNFENDDNFTHLLVRGFTGANGNDLDTNDDGVLDTTPWTAVVDSVSLVKSLSSTGTERFYSTTLVGPDGSFVPGHVYRLPDGTGAFRIGNFNGGEDSAGAANSAAVATDARIFEVQGAGHVSPYVGVKVRTQGIVTAVDSNGFYAQDAAGDGDDATSDGILVFTSSAPTVAVGDDVTVEGVVAEFTPGGVSTGNLSTTELLPQSVAVATSGNTLPGAVVLGPAGRSPPTENVDDDDFALFDPASDGIDFYESLEGMRVRIDDAVAVSPRNGFGEVWVLAGSGAGATGLNARGGITISATDYNPERMQVQYDDGVLPGFGPSVQVGDALGDVTGVVSYNFGNFEVVVTESFSVTSGGLAPETTPLTAAADGLTIAGFNVLNLDPNDLDGNDDVANGQFGRLAVQVVGALRSPDVIALQEVQDDSGSADDGTVSADVTLQTLADAIVAAGGPAYAYVDAPPADGEDGGEPGGNIRVAYLYDPSRVTLVTGSVRRITDTDLSDGDAFENSRKPLVAQFLFNTRKVTLVDLHMTSKGGSTPIFGRVQPFTDGGAAQRAAQASVLRADLDALFAADPFANVVVIGDCNDFDFSQPLQTLAGSGATAMLDLVATEPAEERYSYVFEGNSQALDHAFVSAALVSAAQHDIVHVNAEFVGAASDHDPHVVRLLLPPPTAAEILAQFDAAVRAGTVGGTSRHPIVAAIELALYRLQLALAAVAERQGRTGATLALLCTSLMFSDGNAAPNDLIAGPARQGLEDQLAAAVAGLRLR